MKNFKRKIIPFAVLTANVLSNVSFAFTNNDIIQEQPTNITSTTEWKRDGKFIPVNGTNKTLKNEIDGKVKSGEYSKVTQTHSAVEVDYNKLDETLPGLNQIIDNIYNDFNNKRKAYEAAIKREDEHKQRTTMKDSQNKIFISGDVNNTSIDDQRIFSQSLNVFFDGLKRNQIITGVSETGARNDESKYSSTARRMDLNDVKRKYPHLDNTVIDNLNALVFDTSNRSGILYEAREGDTITIKDLFNTVSGDKITLKATIKSITSKGNKRDNVLVSLQAVRNASGQVNFENMLFYMKDGLNKDNIIDPSSSFDYNTDILYEFYNANGEKVDIGAAMIYNSLGKEETLNMIWNKNNGLSPKLLNRTKTIGITDRGIKITGNSEANGSMTDGWSPSKERQVLIAGIGSEVLTKQSTKYYRFHKSETFTVENLIPPIEFNRPEKPELGQVSLYYKVKRKLKVRVTDDPREEDLYSKEFFLNEGANYNTTKTKKNLERDGYFVYRIEGIENEDGEGIERDREVVYYVNEIKTSYVDTNGKMVKPTEKGAKPAPEISNHILIESKTTENGNVIHKYRKIHTRFINDQGEELEVVDGNVPSKAIANHILLGSETNTDGDTTHRYRKVYTKYINERGEAIQEDKVGTHTANEGIDSNVYRLISTETKTNGDTIHTYKRLKTVFKNIKDDSTIKEENRLMDKDDIPGYKYIGEVESTDGKTYMYSKLETMYLNTKGETISEKAQGTLEAKDINEYQHIETRTLENGDKAHIYRRVKTISVDEENKKLDEEEGLKDPKDIPAHKFIDTIEKENKDRQHNYRALRTIFKNIETGKEIKNVKGLVDKEDIKGLFYDGTEEDKASDRVHRYLPFKTIFITEKGTEEKSGTLEAPEKDGMKLVSTKVEKNKTIHTYKNIYTRFLDTKGNEIQDKVPGIVEDKKINDYIIVNSEIINDDKVITYKKIETQFVDEKGNPLKDEEEGRKEATEIKGYILINKDEESLGIVKYIYKQYQTRFVDEKGNEIKTKDGITEKEDIKGYNFIETNEDKIHGIVTHKYQKEEEPAQPTPVIPEIVNTFKSKPALIGLVLAPLALAATMLGFIKRDTLKKKIKDLFNIKDKSNK